MADARPIDFAATLLECLTADSEKALADQLHAAYVTTKATLREQLYDGIAAAQPNLTDHGIRHVDNVLFNALRLLGDGRTQLLTGRELYCLGMSILFHDAGNLIDRDSHRDWISSLHDNVRGKDGSLLRERTLITRAARAHTGTALDGSTDTLRDVSNEEHFNGEPVRLREIAALLRLADELAEGPQRTSDLMQAQGAYSKESEKYHQFASDVHMLIDRSNGRLVMTFEIDLQKTGPKRRWTQDLRARLSYAYERIQKLDQERRYTGFYSNILRVFRSTEASFNFHHDTEIVEIGLDPLRLTDIVLPDGPQKAIPTIDSAYDLATLIPRLAAATEKGALP